MLENERDFYTGRDDQSCGDCYDGDIGGEQGVFLDGCFIHEGSIALFLLSFIPSF